LAGEKAGFEFSDISGLGSDKSIANSVKTRAKKGRNFAIFEFPFFSTIFARFSEASAQQKSPCFTGFLHFRTFSD